MIYRRYCIDIEKIHENTIVSNGSNHKVSTFQICSTDDHYSVGEPPRQFHYSVVTICSMSLSINIVGIIGRLSLYCRYIISYNTVIVSVKHRYNVIG